MKFGSYVSLFVKAALAVALTFITTSILLGQEKVEKLEKAEKGEYKAVHKEFCGKNQSWGEKVHFSELREMTLPASGRLDVDAGRNGGIKVKGANRGDILVRACIQTWGISEEAARSLASSVKISTSPVVKAENGGDESGWSVSYEVLVPRSTDLKLIAHNGGISIGAVEGRLEFETTNGGVSLHDVAGDIKGRTTNGGVNVSLSGASLRGGGIDVQTTNGGVHLSIPETFAANIETSTTNGGFSSNIAALKVEKDPQDRSRGSRINTAINGGGPLIRLVTTNGGVRINSTGKSTIY